MFNINKIEEIKDFKTFQTYLASFDVSYTAKALTKNSDIQVIIVDNQELAKISRSLKDSVDYGKGQHKFYYIENDVISLYNYFGWQGNYEADSTTNTIDIVQGINPKLQELLELDSDEVSIRDIEKIIKSIYGYTQHTTPKFKDIESFIVAKPKLFTKYVQEFMGDSILYVDALFLTDILDWNFVNKDLPLPKNYNFINHKEFKKLSIIFVSKINKYLSKKESTIRVKDLFMLLEDYNSIIHLTPTLISYNTIKHAGAAMFFGLNLSADKIKALKEVAVINSNMVDGK